VRIKIIYEIVLLNYLALQIWNKGHLKELSIRYKQI